MRLFVRRWLRRRRTRSRASPHELEDRYRLLFDANPLPIWVYDAESLAILAANRAAVADYGYTRSELVGMSFRDIRGPVDAGEVLERAERRRVVGQEETVRFRTKDGRLLDVQATSRALRFGGRDARLVIAVDVSERRRLEEQLARAQRLEALGRLAGGVAHDFNNVLNVIVGYAELALRRTEPADRRAHHLAEIRKAAEQAVGMTRQLLAFSRGQVMQPRVLDVSAVVADMERMIQQLVGEDVEVVTNLTAEDALCRVDSAQLSQVLLNLAVNSRDAMPDGGRLEIETANVTLDEPQGQRLGVEPGRYVLLTVTDTGCGMSREVLAHAFEPFFTTKERDKGTGLGLATVYGIVTQSGGAVTAESAPGAGATLKVYLPRVEAAEAHPAAEVVRAPAAKGAETVLLAEDDPAVRDLTREVLEESGYAVLAATGGPEALELAGKHRGPIHVLLTDLMMPRMDGRELAGRLQSVRPGLRVLYMSGYAPEAMVQRGVLDPGAAFVGKPVRPEELLRKVREVLGAPPSNGFDAGDRQV